MGEGMISSERPVWEIRPLGSIRGDWKRSYGGERGACIAKGAGKQTPPIRLPLPRQSPTLQVESMKLEHCLYDLINTFN